MAKAASLRRQISVFVPHWDMSGQPGYVKSLNIQAVFPERSFSIEAQLVIMCTPRGFAIEITKVSYITPFHTPPPLHCPAAR